ncbi:mevalonate kinase-like [Nylanderia fulva]|uniref:mevalonate kinase-like n=1 Tax=Nylanderia fulva TaxID=613905 RepID=UPI0010FB4BB5|nr:mevalonate kinase-like [Nylanderia fulva]XP_029168850.1 mevalonate kinase-like [Nylanderia fulva]
MVSFKISAPGRIVLAGEHSAMYQKHFVSTSLDRRTKLTFRELPEGWPIEIEFPDVNLQIQVPLEEVRSFFSEEQENQLNLNFRIKYVKSFITFNGMWQSFTQRFSLQMFFYLLYSIAVYEKLDIRSFHVHVTTNIPLDAGLGSSTSFAVCLAACFLHWCRLQSDHHENIEFNHIDFLMDVGVYVKNCEERMQDYQYTQIDTDVCVFGFATNNLLADNYVEYVFEDFEEMARIKILLIDSGIRQEKCDQARQMAQLKTQSSFAFDYMFNILNNLSLNMYYWLNLLSINIRNGNLAEQEFYYEKLQWSIKESRILLQYYSLSDEAFNRIFEIAQIMGYSAKLTGFGPKYAYILLPSHITNNEITEISTHLRNENYLVISTSINCDGVRLEN